VIVNNLDLGQFSLNQGPTGGQNVSTVSVEGFGDIPYSRGKRSAVRSTTVNVQAPFAIGGAAAGSRQAVRYAVQQLVEMALNADQQPVYIQWESGHGNIVANPYDGWYVLNEVTPLDWRFNTFVPCQFTATRIGVTPPKRVALAYAGGALATNFSGTPKNLLAFPIGATVLDFGVYGGNRAAAQGTVSTQTPQAAPCPFVESGTLANWFRGDVEVYDTINTGSNPVPSSGGTFINANWVQVFSPDHDFVGDCVITNGLHLMLISAGSAVLLYLWSTGLATANWQQWTSLDYLSTQGNASTVKGYGLSRVGAEETSIGLTFSESSGKILKAFLRLGRGRYDVRVDVNPQSQAESAVWGMFRLSILVGTSKIIYNSGKVSDQPLNEQNNTPQADYGYAAGFIASASFPFIYGFLYQNQPTGNQPYNPGSGQSYIAIGDSLSLAQYGVRSYGFFAIPYGVSGQFSTANLQGEAENGTKTGGAVSQANASASNGNEVKVPSTTAAGWKVDTIISSKVHPGTYTMWVRVKVTSTASALVQTQLQLWDSTSSSSVGTLNLASNSSGTFNGAPWAVGTSYSWIPVGDFVLNGTDTYDCLVQGITNAAQTDWFFDEVALLPKTLTTDVRGPQDIWQQFMYDRSVKLIRQ